MAPPAAHMRGRARGCRPGTQGLTVARDADCTGGRVAVYSPKGRDTVVRGTETRHPHTDTPPPSVTMTVCSVHNETSPWKGKHCIAHSHGRRQHNAMRTGS
eukprot:EG_transcript_35407